MKYAPSIAFDEFAGSAKGVTAAKSRGRKYISGFDNSSNSATQSEVKPSSVSSPRASRLLQLLRLQLGNCDEPSAIELARIAEVRIQLKTAKQA